MPEKDITPQKPTQNIGSVSTNTPDTTPKDADLVSKSVGISYIGSYKEQSSSVENPIDEATKGNICFDQKNRVEEYNAVVSRGAIGQVVEIHGHKETGIVMAKFENQDGSLAHETITSAPTPPNVDREDYYDDFNHMFGQRDESFLPPVLVQDTSTEVASAQERDEPSTALGKRKLVDSDEQTNKRSKRNGDDDNEGSGSTTSGSSDIGTSGPIDSAGPSNFRSFLDQTLVILISITSSILDAVNEIFILM